MKRPLVSFVVLNWNGIDDTLVCLDSIRKQTVKNYEIIVVDNGSASEQKETLRKIDDITFIDLPQNTGFTGGQIAAYRQARGEYIALINNDAVIAPDWAGKALASFKQNDKLAAIGGRTYAWNDAQKLPAFSTTNPFSSYFAVNIYTGHTRPMNHGDQVVNVDSVSGSAVVICRKAIEGVGYFDNTYFAYYEETDLFARYKRAGFDVSYNPAMHAWHKIGQSTKSKPDFYLYHMHRNRFRFAIKNYDARYAWRFFFYYAHECMRAAAVIAKHGKTARREEVNLLKAATWNVVRLPALLWQRHKTQQLGPTYSKLLLQDAGEAISVIIPCYNYANFVGKAIESVLRQTRPADEIIVINDGSPDNTMEVLKKYKDKVRIIDQKNHGLVATKNIGLREATGDWVVFFDADDELDETFLEKLYVAARRTNADVVYSAMRFIGNDDGIFWSRPFSRRSLRKGNYINNSSLIRRSSIESVGGYKQEMAFGFEDWELYVALAEVGARFQYVREPLLFYRRHSDNSRDMVAKKKVEKARHLVRKLHPRLFSKKYELMDFFFGILLFGKQRTPLQMLKDIRYIAITQLDKLGAHFKPINKLMGFVRLLRSGKYKQIVSKIGLNMERTWKKIVR